MSNTENYRGGHRGGGRHHGGGRYHGGGIYYGGVYPYYWNPGFYNSPYYVNINTEPSCERVSPNATCGIYRPIKVGIDTMNNGTITDWQCCKSRNY